MPENVKWSEIIDIFSHVSDLTPDKRKVVLKDLKLNSPNIYQEVISLLNENKDLHPLLQNQLVEWNMEDDDALIGMTIGPYKLASILGSGGMGSVFLGERIDGEFDQQVAIKLVRPGLYRDQLMEQFREERQILASLQHGSIAKLYDGGTTEDGRVYFVMEYLDGLPLNEYLQTYQPSLQKRLKIFQNICQGIAYAHSKLVLHLDIKPGNIMISADGHGKILDFGISKKVMDEKSDFFQQENGQIGKFTIGFASPEQINKNAVSTKSDVYALGTLLYYMLTDQLPYGSYDTDKNSYLQNRKSNSPTPASESTVLFNKNKLSGDLDTIINESIQLDPDRRYESVLALYDDIEAYLHHRPISLRRSEKGYIAHQYFKRNKASILTAAASISAIFLLVGYYTFSLQKERNTAIIEKEKKQEVVDLMTGLFAQASPYETQGKEITVDTFMQNATTDLLNKTDIDPEVKGELLSMLGDVFSALNNYSMADSLLFLTEDLYQKEGVGGEKMAFVQSSIGSMMYGIGEYEKARQYLHHALDFYLDNDPANAANIYLELGHIAGDNSQLQLSDSLYLLAKDIYEKIYKPPHEDLATIYTSLGINKRYLEEYEEAEKYYLSSINMWQKLVEEPNTEIAYNLNHLASNYYNQQKYDDALPYAKESLRQRELTLGPNHMETLASASNVSRILAAMGNHQEVLPVYKSLLQKMLNIFGERHTYVSSTYANVGNTFRSLQQWDSAAYYLEKGLEVFNGLKEQPEIRKVNNITGLGLLYLDQQNYQKALPYLQENVGIQSRHRDEEHHSLGLGYFYLGKCMNGMNDPQSTDILVKARNILSLQEEGYDKELKEIKELLSDG